MRRKNKGLSCTPYPNIKRTIRLSVNKEENVSKQETTRDRCVPHTEHSIQNDDN